MAAQVTLHEAAAYLGVSKTTLRNWDQEGKLTAIKNPADGTRLYDMTELLAVKQAMGGVCAKNAGHGPEMDSKAIKRIIHKLHGWIRDGDANSNIVTRFDEISKLLFIKLYGSRTGRDPFIPFRKETAEAYSARIQAAYLNAVKDAQAEIPGQFGRLNLDAATLYKCGVELSKADFSSAGRDIKGMAYENIIKGTFDKNDNQQFFTPHQIVDFMAQLAEPFIAGTVCDPACVRNAPGYFYSGNGSRRAPGVGVAAESAAPRTSFF